MTEFAWLSKKAADFGFVLRSPKKKTGISGYIYEPWRYRCIGHKAALELVVTGKTLENTSMYNNLNPMEETPPALVGRSFLKSFDSI